MHRLALAIVMTAAPMITACSVTFGGDGPSDAEKALQDAPASAQALMQKTSTELRSATGDQARINEVCTTFNNRARDWVSFPADYKISEVQISQIQRVAFTCINDADGAASVIDDMRTGRQSPVVGLRGRFEEAIDLLPATDTGDLDAIRPGCDIAEDIAEPMNASTPTDITKFLDDEGRDALSSCTFRPARARQYMQKAIETGAVT